MAENKHGKDATNLRSYSWLVRGKQREAVIKVMDRPEIPSRICREAKKLNEKISLNSMCDVLRNFVEKGIVIHLNSKEKVGRSYELTKKGRILREKILKE